MAVEVGEQAPDFELKDQHGTPVRLSSSRGKKNVVIVFYPFAFSGVCSGEMCAIRDEFPEVSGDDVELLAVSVDTGFSLRTWADQQHFGFEMLSDFWPHGAVAQSYGVFNDDAGFANRGTFVVDRSGIVRFAEMKQPGEPRDQAVWTDALKALQPR